MSTITLPAPTIADATTPVEVARLRWTVSVVEDKCGLTAARQSQTAAVDSYEALLPVKREAEAALRIATDQLTDARLDAAWQLGGRFVVEGNKTYLVIHDDGPDVPTRRAMTADKQAEYIAGEVKRQPEVAQRLAEHRKCSDAVEVARDAIAVAERRIAAAKYDLAAAVQMLATITSAFQTGGQK